MHAVEVSGFLPYIHDNVASLGKAVAGLCIDSVGQDFAKCGGEAILFQSPEHAPSFIDGLLEVLLTAAAAESVGRFTRDNYAAFPWHAEPFWGNDAFISDGYFDIPTPQLSTWPDRYYHSNLDTPDQMSENTLGRMGAVMGTYLYLLATAGAKEARWFAHLAVCDWKRRICGASADRLTSDLTGEPTPDAPACVISLLHHLGLQGRDAVVQAGRFAPEDDRLRDDLGALSVSLRSFAEREAAEAAHAIRSATGLPGLPKERDCSAEGESLTARRLRWSAPPRETLSDAANERLAELSSAGDPPHDLNRIWKWINGRRTAREIYDRLRHGGEIPLATVVEYLRLMEREGMVELVS